MSDTKISALTAASAAADANEFPINEAGLSKKLSASQIKTYMMGAPGAIGGTTPAAGAFTTVSATGQVTSTLANGTAPLVVASSTNVANLNASSLSGATFSAPGAIGGGTPAAAAFTTISATGAITSTLATGNAPLVVASTTNVANLNASTLSGKTHADPGPIGSGTPSTGAFTTLSAGTSAALTSPTFAAGSASAGSWPVFTPGTTVLTSAVAGTVEVDANCIYGTTDALNRGVIPVEQFIIAASTRTFTSNTTAQAIFSSPANGAVTLAAGTYLFQVFVCMDTMSATSGNAQFGLAGTATLGSILYTTFGQDQAADATIAGGGIWTALATTTSGRSLVAQTGAAMNLTGHGSLNVTVAGTLIPQLKLETAASAVVKVGSYFRIRRIGAAGVVSVGNWS